MCGSSQRCPTCMHSVQSSKAGCMGLWMCPCSLAGDDLGPCPCVYSAPGPAALHTEGVCASLTAAVLGLWPCTGTCIAATAVLAAAPSVGMHTQPRRAFVGLHTDTPQRRTGWFLRCTAVGFCAGRELVGRWTGLQGLRWLLGRLHSVPTCVKYPGLCRSVQRAHRVCPGLQRTGRQISEEGLETGLTGCLID